MLNFCPMPANASPVHNMDKFSLFSCLYFSVSSLKDVTYLHDDNDDDDVELMIMMMIMMRERLRLTDCILFHIRFKNISFIWKEGRNIYSATSTLIKILFRVRRERERFD